MSRLLDKLSEPKPPGEIPPSQRDRWHAEYARAVRAGADERRARQVATDAVYAGLTLEDEQPVLQWEMEKP